MTPVMDKRGGGSDQGDVTQSGWGRGEWPL